MPALLIVFQEAADSCGGIRLCCCCKGGRLGFRIWGLGFKFVVTQCDAAKAGGARMG